MRAAAAEIAGQRFFDLAVRGLRVFIEQCLGAHDYATDAIATLGRLFINEGLL